MEEINTKKKSDVAFREEKILEFWKENKTFEKSLEQSEGKKEFIFYEGPPTANGKPGTHHLEARAFKDAIPRYKTMQGFHVRRKGGWDTHGLPVELQVEKKLGLNSKKAIEEYGIAKFNKQCKESVWEYLEYWEKFTDRIGFWLDQENPYITYRNQYIESVWNVIKETEKKGLLYKDYKVVPWCPRCGTALSSHELAQGYENVKDLSVYVKFRVLSGNVALGRSLSPSADGALPLDPSVCETPPKNNISAGTYILAWTTTPWTLPGNVALAVGEKVDYVKIKKENEILILAKSRLSIIEGEYEIIEELKGKDLLGLEYEPLYPYLQNTIFESEKGKMEKAFKVYPANFVTTEDGTGVVHTAVMYGQDDFVLGTEIGLPKHHLVGLDGKFLSGTDFLEGRFVRDEAVAVDIIKDLAHRGLLLKKEKYEHSYPHCWRCHTALIYYARDSWYIRMSSLRDELVKENEGINWEPDYIKEGRFGEWLREIKDWAISRERYWGTPLPVWTCEKCKGREVIGSVEDIKKKVKKSGNNYFVMRHGEAENNLFNGNVYYKDLNHSGKLTEKGKQQAKDSAKNFKEKIDIIISSPFLRTVETTKIACEEINFPLDKVIYDERIQECETSSFFEGKDASIFKKYYDEDIFHSPKEALPNGESFVELMDRVGSFFYELESKYAGKNILIISHQGVVRALSFIVQGTTFDDLIKSGNTLLSLDNSEIKKFDFIPLPHDEDYELDLHKPYIDEVELVCTHSTDSGQVCGGKLERTKEVMDVWLDSGSMPFAQDHYPFNKNIQYPADFISEAIDQTRGWFYTLHAVGILMGRGKSFKNVICLGHILDAKGKKMSKSIGNIIDPWEMMDKYGVDTLRLWMYSVNQPGESKNFDEKTVAELHNKVFNLLYNVLAFYELYRNKDLENAHSTSSGQISSTNVLDIWILSRLDELNALCVEKIENYKLLEPARAFREFIDDLSTWYLRRSRDRIKEGDKEAKQTLYFVLKNLAKIMAPFTPFASEDIWQKLKNDTDEESVHLASWPEVSEINSKIIEEMQKIREIVSIGLQARQKAGIPVRQPLALLNTFGYRIKTNLIELVRDELNVKKVQENESDKPNIELDIDITPELKQEGNYRELARAVQDIRKKEGLTPSDIISLSLETNEEGKKLIQKFETEIKKTVLASEVKLEKNNGIETKINDLVFKISIQK